MGLRFRKLVLCSHLLAVACCAVAQDRGPAFAVASVKAAPGADPNTGSWSTPGVGRFDARHVSLMRLLQLAYGVDVSQIANKPEWADSDLYDISARPEEGVLLSRDELEPRLQALLQDRLHLVAHVEMRSTRGYALVIAKGGPRLTQTKGDHFPGWRLNVSAGQMRGLNWSMPILAKYLTGAAGFPVVDETQLGGSYDIGFSFASDAEMDGSLPSLADALKQATGLALRPQPVLVKTVVIDAIARTVTEN